MLPIEKLHIILQAYKDYLRLDDLACASIEHGRGAYQRVFDQGVQIVQNKLMIQRSLFDLLKHRCDSRSPVSFDDGVALALPTVRKVKGRSSEQRNLFHPPFVVEISAIFRGNYHSSGWDLTDSKFEILPVAPNLVEFFGLQEPDIDTLVVSEGIHRFLQDLFKRPFSTVQDFLRQVDLPEGGCFTSRAPYLVRWNLQPYNASLREEIDALQQQLLGGSEVPQWCNPSYPFMKFLFGTPSSPQQDSIFWAAAPGHILDSFQQAALKSQQEDTLIAVWGGPGCGKTELAPHWIAQQVWQRAHSIIHLGTDVNNLCVFSATNNGAIDKFKVRLNSTISSKLFYLPGGNRTVIKDEGLPKLRGAIDYLQSTPYNSEIHTQARNSILALEAKLHQIVDQNQEFEAQRQKDEHSASQFDSEIANLERSIADLELSLNLYSSLKDYADFPRTAYEEIQKDLDQASQELPYQDDSWRKRAIDWIGAVSDKSVFQRLARRIHANWLHTQSFPGFEFVFPTEREQLEAARLEVEELLNFSQQWQEEQDKKAKIEQQIQEKHEALAVLQEGRQVVQVRLNQCATVDFYDRFHQENHELQVQLFQKSWDFLEQEALLRREEMLETLRIYEGTLQRNEESIGEIKLNAERFFTRLSLVFPVLSSTLQSLSVIIPALEPNLIRFTILEEMGATPPHQVLPVLARSQQVAALGDPKQIEPILNLCPDTIQEYCKRSFLNRGLTFQDYERYAPTAKDTATAFHLAAGASGECGDLGNAIVLRNHYRSVPAIITFCSPNYPGGLNILTTDRRSALGSNLIAYSVEGEVQDRVNLQEIQAVEKIINQLLNRSYKINQIGVLSPFFHQASALRFHLLNRWRNFSYYDIGTIHSFQGGEKPVIILSPYQCDRSFLSYINRRPNLLNTAVSRAEELFILIGNLEQLEATGETRRLIQHCKQYGEIRSLPEG
ncbi:superfamily I DNA/RNA helicase (plasmid) [Leptolyngbya sp. NIES-3755]|nr:superfamily I DNA/RNA helicase [Leptolyngbya sp. NIES-3755]